MLIHALRANVMTLNGPLVASPARPYFSVIQRVGMHADVAF